LWTAYLCEILEEFVSTENLCDLDELVIVLSEGSTIHQTNNIVERMSRNLHKHLSREKEDLDGRSVSTTTRSNKVSFPQHVNLVKVESLMRETIRRKGRMADEGNDQATEGGKGGKLTIEPKVQPTLQTVS